MLRFAALIVALALALPTAAQDKTLRITLGYPPGAADLKPSQ